VPAVALIAIIDDDESACAAIMGLVRSLGFNTVGFHSAAEFLQSDDVLRTACVIADVQMPGMSGLELHRQLVATGSSIPTILVTAYPDETTRRLALQAGVTSYLAKPVRPENLLDCIRKALAPSGEQPS